MSSDPSSRNNPELYQGGHPSNYNPNRPGLTSEISDELTAYAIRAPQFIIIQIYICESWTLTWFEL